MPAAPAAKEAATAALGCWGVLPRLGKPLIAERVEMRAQELDGAAATAALKKKEAAKAS